jgi:hypothetical protein
LAKTEAPPSEVIFPPEIALVEIIEVTCDVNIIGTPLEVARFPFYNLLGRK